MTLLRIGESFYNVDSYNGSVAASEEIQGALLITIDNVPFVDEENWDTIDQLWEYMITAVQEIKRGNEFVTYYPDQPIELKFIPLSGGMMMLSHESATTDLKHVTLSTDQFIAEVTQKAESFFEKMMTFCHQNSAKYKQNLKKLHHTPTT